MTRYFPYTLCCLVGFLAAIPAFSQGITVKASLNRDHIIIGEPIELTLEAQIPNGSATTWFPADSLEHFEFIEKGKIDTASGEETSRYRQVLKLTSFDSGKWVLPSLALEMGNRRYLTDSFSVSVAFSNADPNRDYHDIKDIEDVPSPDTWLITSLVGLAAFISLAGLAWVLRKKAAPVAAPPSPWFELPPLQAALLELDQIRQDNPDLKEYFSRLNDVLRRYLQGRTGENRMDKTSAELIMDIRPRGLDNDSFTALAQTLRMGDAVKFAKYRPGEDEQQQAWEAVRNSLEELDRVIK
jgi:hypothetical protein